MKIGGMQTTMRQLMKCCCQSHLLDIGDERTHLWAIKPLCFDIIPDDKTRQNQYIFHRFVIVVAAKRHG